jgi:hypothetical protein
MFASIDFPTHSHEKGAAGAAPRHVAVSLLSG